eukprot:TRINITY_DN4013_c1_g6_i1.p1 TRINITY_DN4013_c1_g6~~TRINITY_DN4013_c1_g6_i1.p1  ORF type:complete len:249 (+),score=31.86 TRINITY_DN4013_c1_g6_i1:146-892(+)
MYFMHDCMSLNYMYALACVIITCNCVSDLPFSWGSLLNPQLPQVPALPAALRHLNKIQVKLGLPAAQRTADRALAMAEQLALRTEETGTTHATASANTNTSSLVATTVSDAPGVDTVTGSNRETDTILIQFRSKVHEVTYPISLSWLERKTIAGVQLGLHPDDFVLNSMVKPNSRFLFSSRLNGKGAPNPPGYEHVLPNSYFNAVPPQDWERLKHPRSSGIFDGFLRGLSSLLGTSQYPAVSQEAKDE